MFTCPVCFFDGLTEPPQDYNICECCGTEFGNDDEARSHEELRMEWLAAGANWFFGEPPSGWNPWKQTQVLVISPYQHQYYATTFAGNSVSYRDSPLCGAPPRHARHSTKGAIEICADQQHGIYGTVAWGERRACA